MGDERLLDIGLREVQNADLGMFFLHQCEPEALAMAAFPSRERDRFFAHWIETVLVGPANRARTITHGDQVCGNVVSFPRDDLRLVGYWLRKEFWGRGIASAALKSFITDEPRPLHAFVATSNLGSIRVLEKCGFHEIARQTEFDKTLGRDVEELLMRLD